MKTVIVLEIDHDKPIPHLADMVAGRAWTINGVNRAEIVEPGSEKDLQAAGFTMREIALGNSDVFRG